MRELDKVILATPSPLSHRTAEENLGIGYISSTLRQNGYLVDIVDSWLEGLSPSQLAERINAEPVLFVGFSTYRSNMDRAVETINLLKATGFNRPIIAGGYGPTFYDQDFLEAGFDVVIKGEAEQTVLELAEHFGKNNNDLGGVRGISFLDNGTQVETPPRFPNLNLDTIPFPARDTLQMVLDRKTPAHILSARGCEAHCTFCSIVAFQRLSKGPQWRQRSIGNFVLELDELATKGVRHLKVIDDSFIEPPRDLDWCRRLADEVENRQLALQLRGSIRADRLDGDILKELKRAGFIGFSCGVENFSQTALNRMGKTANLDQNLEALRLFQQEGLIMQQGMILFDYGTTIEELEQNYQGLRENDFTVVKGIFSEMYAAAGTPFTRVLEKKGFLQTTTSTNTGNAKYEIQDNRVGLVYSALKAWHQNHSKIYDMTIDPISAPKALEPAERQKFLALVKEIRHKDLDFFRLVLDTVEGGSNESEVVDLTNAKIDSNKEWYLKFNSKVLSAYSSCNLVYDATVNQFLC